MAGREAAVKGFKAPLPGTKMCIAENSYASDGLPLKVPQRCKRPAASGGAYCGLHERLRVRYVPIERRDGGWCVWFGAPARSYVRDGVTIALCGICSRSLVRVIRRV